MADHSYYVTCYGLEIAKRIRWYEEGDATEAADRMRLLLAEYLLRHDEDEALTGDVPGPVKRKCGMLSDSLKQLLADRFGPPPEFTPAMKAIKKAADLMDECMYLAGEMAMGNQTVRSSFDNAWNRLSEAVDALPADGDRKSELLREMSRRISEQSAYTKNYAGLLGV